MTQFDVLLSFNIDGTMRRFPDTAKVIVYTDPRCVFVAINSFKHEFHTGSRFQRSQQQVLIYELGRLTALLVFSNEQDALHFITLSGIEQLRTQQMDISEDIDLDMLVQHLQDDSFIAYCQQVDQVLQMLMI